MLRFPVGIATAVVASTAVATPFIVAYAPLADQYGGKHPFGEWSQSSRIEAITGSAWGYLLIPLGAAMLIGSVHLMNAMARAGARWTTTSLDIDRRPS